MLTYIPTSLCAVFSAVTYCRLCGIVGCAVFSLVGVGAVFALKVDVLGEGYIKVKAWLYF